MSRAIQRGKRTYARIKPDQEIILSIQYKMQMDEVGRWRIFQKMSNTGRDDIDWEKTDRVNATLAEIFAQRILNPDL